MTPEVRDCQSSGLTTINIPMNTIVVSLWYFISYSDEEGRDPQKGKPLTKHGSPREILLIIIVRHLTRSINTANCFGFIFQKKMLFYQLSNYCYCINHTQSQNNTKRNELIYLTQKCFRKTNSFTASGAVTHLISNFSWHDSVT